MKIKAFITNRNLLTWPKKMVGQLLEIPNIEPIILDNDSSYEPLLEWYDTAPCKVIKLRRNFLHTALWNSGLFHQLVKEDYYIVSDPDLDLEGIPKDVVEKLIEGVEKFNQTKCGLALKIDDIPLEFPLRDQVLEWESPFWTSPLGDGFYNAPVDTTFSLHKTSKCRIHKVGGIRLGDKYTCRHMPWYLTKDNITEEYGYYLKHRAALAPDNPSVRKFFNDWAQKSLEEQK